jgi:hypothetical protein
MRDGMNEDMLIRIAASHKVMGSYSSMARPAERGRAGHEKLAKKRGTCCHCHWFCLLDSGLRDTQLERPMRGFCLVNGPPGSIFSREGHMADESSVCFQMLRFGSQFE